MTERLAGVVQPGRGLGAVRMTGIEGARLGELLGFPVVPGTLNVRLPAPVERDSRWRYVSAEEIGPEWGEATGQAGYFLVPIRVEGRYRGVAFQADESGYPVDQVELICETHLRQTLGLADGDTVGFEID